MVGGAAGSHNVGSRPPGTASNGQLAHQLASQPLATFCVLNAPRGPLPAVERKMRPNSRSHCSSAPHLCGGGLGV